MDAVRWVELCVVLGSVLMSAGGLRQAIKTIEKDIASMRELMQQFKAESRGRDTAQDEQIRELRERMAVVEDRLGTRSGEFHPITR